MTLHLPADLETHVNPDRWHDPGVYALVLAVPDNVGALWDRRFDTRPEWFDRFASASAVYYVGATGDLLSRLEDHRDGDVRQATVLKVSEIDRLRNVWPFDDVDRAFQWESKLALWLDRYYDHAYVHQR